MRNWTSHAAFRIGQFLFYYRLVGVLAFELLDARAMLLLFPNTFEYFFIVYALIALRWEPARVSPRFWLWTAAGLWVFVKLPQEYWIHIAQLDFTETVADYPWFGVACALVVLGAASRVVLLRRPPTHARARPRLALRRRAASLATAVPGRGLGWTELVEKTVLLRCSRSSSPTILPTSRRPRSRSRSASSRSSPRTRRSARLRALRSRTCEFGALLVVNLGLIYLVSRFFSDAEDFPLGTALFFAFLITLLISLYDLYKPVYDERFGS